MTLKKFKNDVGEDFYKQKVKEYAKDKNVEAAMKLCDNCGELEFCHKPGPCKRSDKGENKLSEAQLSEIRQAINRDIIAEIIEDAKSENKPMF